MHGCSAAQRHAIAAERLDGVFEMGGIRRLHSQCILTDSGSHYWGLVNSLTKPRQGRMRLVAAFVYSGVACNFSYKLDQTCAKSWLPLSRRPYGPAVLLHHAKVMFDRPFAPAESDGAMLSVNGNTLR